MCFQIHPLSLPSDSFHPHPPSQFHVLFLNTLSLYNAVCIKLGVTTHLGPGTEFRCHRPFGNSKMFLNMKRNIIYNQNIMTPRCFWQLCCAAWLHCSFSSKHTTYTQHQCTVAKHLAQIPDCHMRCSTAICSIYKGSHSYRDIMDKSVSAFHHLSLACQYWMSIYICILLCWSIWL